MGHAACCLLLLLLRQVASHEPLTPPTLPQVAVVETGAGLRSATSNRTLSPWQPPQPNHDCLLHHCCCCCCCCLHRVGRAHNRPPLARCRLQIKQIYLKQMHLKQVHACPTAMREGAGGRYSYDKRAYMSKMLQKYNTGRGWYNSVRRHTHHVHNNQTREGGWVTSAAR